MSVLWEYKTPLTTDEITEYLFPGYPIYQRVKYVSKIVESLIKKGAIYVDTNKANVAILTPQNCLATYMAKYKYNRRFI